VTELRAGIVDVCVIRESTRGWRILTLRRAQGTIRPGSWEFVHGRIDGAERPAVAARRELHEETGLSARKLYSITVNPFYLLRTDVVQLAIVFAAFVDSAAVTLGPEHDRHEWLAVEAARKRLTWPRDAEAVGHARRLLSAGRVAAIEDVLLAGEEP
jgi:8-oxo-dGTP pyrophosphatase MutT (NUDIX family)